MLLKQKIPIQKQLTIAMDYLISKDLWGITIAYMIVEMRLIEAFKSFC